MQIHTSSFSSSAVHSFTPAFFVDSTRVHANQINLTQDGLSNIDKVLQTIFFYFGKLVMMEPQKWIFDEIRSVSEMKFQHSDEVDFEDYAVGITNTMPFCPPQDILQYEYIFEVRKRGQTRSLWSYSL